MVIFNECRIDPINNRLILEVSIDSTAYSTDVGIDSIYLVKSADFVNEYTLPESKVLIYEPSDDKPIDVSETINVGTSVEPQYKKRVRIVKSQKELSMLGIELTDVLFIYVETTGTPGESCPCECDSKYHMSVAFSLRGIYNKAMSYIKELDSKCDTPRNFINLFLKLKAFELSLRTGNFNKAITIWGSFNHKLITPSRVCGCN